MRVRTWSVAVMGLWLGWSVPGFGQQPVPAIAPYQPMTLAQTIARTLKESGQLARYNVQVMVQGNMVDLVGEVADENQRAIVITIARSTPGVAIVRDWMQVLPEGSIAPAQGFQPLPTVEKDPGRIDGQPVLPDPMPIFQAPPGPNPAIQPPPMPPYAWPTYAPYNNYSRVAYPNAYPYEQWPFIGPMYPFPRVPLGWRSVTLTWEDGHWWFHRNPTGHDWWRVRYW